MATNLNAVAKSPPAAIVADDRYATSNRNWHVTNVEEMRAFFAINMAMGISEKPEYKDFWCADPVLRNMFISSTMPRLRYEKLCHYLHCSVVENEDAGDKLAMVRPLITLCDRQFKAYKPKRVGWWSDDTLRRAPRLEAIYALEACKVGHEDLVPVWLGDGLLLCLLHLHGCHWQPKRWPWSRVSSGNEPNAPLSVIESPRVCWQLFHVSPSRQGSAARRHLLVWHNTAHSAQVSEHSRCHSSPVRRIG